MAMVFPTLGPDKQYCIPPRTQHCLTGVFPGQQMTQPPIWSRQIKHRVDAQSEIRGPSSIWGFWIIPVKIYKLELLTLFKNLLRNEKRITQKDNT